MADNDSSVSFRLRREAGGIAGRARHLWGRWWVKLLLALAVLAGIAYAAFFVLFARDLP